LNEAFNDLKEEKKQKIINAALKEFTERGFNLASTNNIVKEAEISKGLLFYYFAGKEELFLFLANHALSIVKNDYLNKLDESETDYIEKLRKAGVLKFKIFLNHQLVFDFIASLYLKDSYAHLTKEMIEEFQNGRIEFERKLYNNINKDLFKDDVYSDKIMEMISFCLSGYEKKITDQIINAKEINYENYWQDFYQFLDNLKKIFYKKTEDNK